MNIGEFVKILKKDYPSVSISKIRFYEKEGLISPKRSDGGTRIFTTKELNLVKQILNLQQDYFYSLKAIKKDKSLLKSKKSNLKKNKIYSKSEILKLSGLIEDQFQELIEFNYIYEKESYSEYDLETFKSWSYFYFLGLSPKNFTVVNTISERLEGFIEYLESSLNLNDVEKKEFRQHVLNLIKGKL